MNIVLRGSCAPDFRLETSIAVPGRVQGYEGDSGEGEDKDDIELPDPPDQL